MKYPAYICTLLAVLLLIFSAEVPAAAEGVWIVDTTRIGRELGFPNGVYTRNNDVRELENYFKQHNPNVLATEGNQYRLDSPEEYIAGLFIVQDQLNSNVKSVIHRHFTADRRTAGLLLGYMWFSRRAQNRITAGECMNGLNRVHEHTGVSLGDMRRYFRDRFGEAVVRMAKQNQMPANYANATELAPVIDYFSSFDSNGNLQVRPAVHLNRMIEKARRYYQMAHTNLYASYIETLSSIDSSLGNELSRQVSGTHQGMVRQ